MTQNTHATKYYCVIYFNTICSNTFAHLRILICHQKSHVLSCLSLLDVSLMLMHVCNETEILVFWWLSYIHFFYLKPKIYSVSTKIFLLATYMKSQNTYLAENLTRHIAIFVNPTQHSLPIGVSTYNTYKSQFGSLNKWMAKKQAVKRYNEV